jgi:hypothetical protein
VVVWWEVGEGERWGGWGERWVRVRGGGDGVRGTESPNAQT